VPPTLPQGGAMVLPCIRRHGVAPTPPQDYKRGAPPLSNTPPSHPTPFEEEVLQLLGETLLRLLLGVGGG